MAFFSKNYVMIIFCKISSSLGEKKQFFAKCFSQNILKIITSVPARGHLVKKGSKSSEFMAEARKRWPVGSRSVRSRKETFVWDVTESFFRRLSRAHLINQFCRNLTCKSCFMWKMEPVSFCTF
jgi:hypothetical protein